MAVFQAIQSSPFAYAEFAICRTLAWIIGPIKVTVQFHRPTIWTISSAVIIFWQAMMVARVFGNTQNDKVLKSIVEFIAIYMMYVFISIELAAEMVFHNFSMLNKTSTIFRKYTIAVTQSAGPGSPTFRYGRIPVTSESSMMLQAQTKGIMRSRTFFERAMDMWPACWHEYDTNMSAM